jgi:hypothetical protein
LCVIKTNREFGIHLKELDLIDESRISAEQMRMVCSILLGVRVDDFPHPSAEFSAFMDTLRYQLDKSPEVYDSVTKKLKKWVDVRSIQKCYGHLPGGGGCCTIS